MLSVLIVNWNTRDYLRACLLSLQSSCAALEHEIIVVDNASGDGSAALVAATFPKVRLIASQTNLGFAAGNNRAYQMATGEFIWLLNPDTVVLDDAPQRMIHFLNSGARRGAVASALIDARTGCPQRSCRTFPTPAALWTEALGLARAFPRSQRYGFYRMGWWRYHDTRRVEQPMASSLMLPRAAIESSGGLFDAQFPIFFNDVDLCWRLRLHAWEVWYLPAAEVLHYGGASTGQVRPDMIVSSHQALARFYVKHYRETLPWPIYTVTRALMTVSGAVRYWLALHQARAAAMSGSAQGRIGEV